MTLSSEWNEVCAILYLKLWNKQNIQLSCKKKHQLDDLTFHQSDIKQFLFTVYKGVMSCYHLVTFMMNEFKIVMVKKTDKHQKGYNVGIYFRLILD